MNPRQIKEKLAGARSAILTKYFDKGLDIKVQIFNLLLLACIPAVTFITVVSVFIDRGFLVASLNLANALILFVLLKTAQRKKCYAVCIWIIIAAIFMVAFPVMFFVGYGYLGGMPFYFVIAIVLTVVMLEKRQRAFAILAELIIYAACFAAYNEFFTGDGAGPGQVYLPDLIAGFLETAVLLSLLTIFIFRLYSHRQKQILVLNHELAARNDALMRYDVMKSDFLGTVAHEINTPLAIIAASSHDTLDVIKINPINVDEIVENQNIIASRVKLIDNIILDLMDSVAIEKGRLSLNRQPLRLHEFLRGVCENVFNKINVNGNTIEYEGRESLDKHDIWADPQRLEQVMVNLLSNASKHTKNGTIKVRTASSDFGAIVSVTDDGEGIDAEIARAALKQYASTKTDYWRHGIGLYLCRKIILAHGGDIWIDSKKGRGTKVTFTLSGEIA